MDRNEPSRGSNMIGLGQAAYGVIKQALNELNMKGEQPEITVTEIDEKRGEVVVFDPASGGKFSILCCEEFCPGGTDHPPHPYFAAYCFDETIFTSQHEMEECAEDMSTVTWWLCTRLLFRRGMMLTFLPLDLPVDIDWSAANN